MSFILSQGFPTSHLFDKVTTQIEKQIFAGTYQSGSVLSESVLSKDLGVSRGPLRESLTLLGAIGLISQQPKRGTYVETFSREQKNEAIAIRLHLEMISIRRLADIYNKSSIEGKNQIITEITKPLEGMSQAVEQSNIPSFFESDLEFHCQIAVLAGCERVAKMIRPQYLTTFLCTRKEFLTVETAEEMLTSMKDSIIGEHTLIWKHIQNNEPEKAIDVLREHLHQAENKWKIAAERLESNSWSKI
jgi:GntR family transcriptional regulator, gluconate operon transcriptional repressor